MPIYEYQCSNCHHTFDLMQKMSDDPVKKCPDCGKNTVERLVSAAGFQLKGTGWYVTDFKNKDKPKNKSSEKTSAEKAPESTSTKDKTD
jgi:putative FmdB family regulatory protein